jgi:hypothetical protein
MPLPGIALRLLGFPACSVNINTDESEVASVCKQACGDKPMLGLHLALDGAEWPILLGGKQPRLSKKREAKLPLCLTT